MGTVLYTPALVEQADELRDEAIIKEIIEEEATSNMSGNDIKSICSKIQGSKKETCYAQLEGSDKTDYTEKELASYWKAVSKGYTKSIADFVKRKDTVSKLLGYGTSIGTALTGLVTDTSNQDVLEDETSSRLSKNARIGIAVGSVVVLGTIAYFIFKQK